MELCDRTIVVTGGGGGIGAAMCRRFAAEQPRGILVADIDEVAASGVAAEVGGVAIAVDVADAVQVHEMVALAVDEFGPVDVMCMNVGVATAGGIDVPDEGWQRAWEINVMSHVFAVREVLPGMLERGSGYLLHTASAAGLLTNLGAAPYSVTKHAVVALAEWLSVTYGDAGIGVSCLAPQFVQTPMLDVLADVGEGFHAFASDISISAETVADAVVAGIREERFLILPHPEVAEYFKAKANDYEHWLRSMRAFQHKLGVEPSPGG